MYGPGHVAASLLVARTWDLNVGLMVGAALFPDVVDKTCRYILQVVPSGRLPTHTLLALTLSTAGVYLVSRLTGRGKKWALSWFVGYALHLLLDLGAPLPFLWPFVSYDLGSYHWTYLLWHTRSPAEIISICLEVALVVAALYVEVRRYRRNRSSALRY